MTIIYKIRRAFTVSLALQQSGNSWSFSTYVLFLVDKGLSLFEVNLLNFVFMFGNFLFDPPTGVLADKIGQKRIYLSGLLFWALAMLVYGTGHSFPQFLAAELLAAIGHSLMSGSLDSWMRNLTNEEVTHKTLAQAGALARIASIPAAILGGIAASVWGLEWPWLLSCAATLVAFIVSALMLKDLPETYHEHKSNLGLKGVALHSLLHPGLRFTLLVAFGQMVFIQPFNMFWPVIFKDLSGQTWWLGTLWAGVAGCLALGSFLAQKGGRTLNGKGIALALMTASVPMLLASLTSNVYLAVAFFLLHEVGRGAFVPMLFSYANRHIPNDIRSTSNSIRSSLGTLGAGIGLLASGYLTTWVSPQTIWGISSAGMILLSLYALKKKD